MLTLRYRLLVAYGIADHTHMKTTINGANIWVLRIDTQDSQKRDYEKGGTTRALRGESPHPIQTIRKQYRLRQEKAKQINQYSLRNAMEIYFQQSRGAQAGRTTGSPCSSRGIADISHCRTYKQSTNEAGNRAA